MSTAAGDVGQLGGDLLGGQPVAQVAAGEREDRPAVGQPERGDPLRRGVRGALAQPHAPRRVVGVGADGGQHLASQLLGRRAGRSRGRCRRRRRPARSSRRGGRPGGRRARSWRRGRPAAGCAAARSRAGRPAGPRPPPPEWSERSSASTSRCSERSGEVGVAGPRERGHDRARPRGRRARCARGPTAQGRVGQQPGGPLAVLEAEPDQPHDRRGAGSPRSALRHRSPVRRPARARARTRSANRPANGAQTSSMCGCAASESRQMVSRSYGLAATPTTSRSAHSWTISGVVSMWNCSAVDVPADPERLVRVHRAAGQQRGARWAARRSRRGGTAARPARAAAGRTPGRRPRRRAWRRASRPPPGRRCPARTRPPPTWASSWAPRQIARVGKSAASACRSSSRTPTSSGLVASSSSADCGPPRTTSPS